MEKRKDLLEKSLDRKPAPMKWSYKPAMSVFLKGAATRYRVETRFCNLSITNPALSHVADIREIFWSQHKLFLLNSFVPFF